jgi:hypothetical protein
MEAAEMKNPIPLKGMGFFLYLIMLSIQRYSDHTLSP